MKKSGKIRNLLAGTVMLAAMLVSTACGAGKDASINSVETGSTANSEAAGAKFGFITGTGGLGDKNINDATHEGLQVLKAEGVEINTVEPGDASDYGNLQRLYAEKGEYAAIFCITFDQADPLTKVAADYPEQRFVLVDSEVDAENVTNVLFRSEETGFQLGVLAGLLEKENALDKLNPEQKVGFVGGQDVPTINAFAAGYKAGVKLVNPACEIDIAYVGSFSDPSKATELANGLYESGSDIIFACAGGSGLGVFASAEKSDGYAFGIEVNQNENAPDNIIASGLRLWDVVMADVGRKAMENSLEGGTSTYGLAEGSLQIGYEKSNVAVSDAVKAEVEEYCEKAANGELTLPTTLDEVESFLSANQ